jgi:class 3 adenylate cyclase
MIDIIIKHKGIVNQFLGDGYMATFGIPFSRGNDILNAVNSSIEILENLKTKIEKNELPNIRIGIGLHAGNVVAGNVGTNQRKQYSISGETVIISSRIEQLNKEFDSQLLISEEVFENIDCLNLNFVDLGKVIVKGRKNPLKIFMLK